MVSTGQAILNATAGLALLTTMLRINTLQKDVERLEVRIARQYSTSKMIIGVLATQVGLEDIAEESIQDSQILDSLANVLDSLYNK